MSSDSIEQKLKAAASSDTRSISARVRDHLPAIEDAIKRGVKLAAVIEILQAEGIDVSMENLKRILYLKRRASAENRLKTGGATETAQKQVSRPAQKPEQHQTANSTQALSDKLRSSSYDPLADN